MIRRPPRSTRTDTLFPYTTLFRSVGEHFRTYCPRCLEEVSADEDVCPLCDKRLIRGGLTKGELERYHASRGAPTLGRDAGISRLLSLISAEPPIFMRSEKRRVGKECVSTCRSRWSAEN